MAAMTRDDALALFAETQQTQVIQETTKRSVALATIRTIPMGNATAKMPVLDALPVAGFLSAPQAVKPVTNVAWDNITLTAEEIAVIVPVGEDVLADATIDVWSSVRDLLAQAFGKAIDRAVFFGTGAPASWPTGGLYGVAASSPALNVLEYDAADPLASWSSLFSLVEDPGGDVNRLWASRRLRGILRTTRDETGNAVPEVNTGGVFGLNPSYPLGWNPVLALAIVGDAEAAIIGIRSDLEFKFSDAATLTGFGNLFEKDTIAIRAKMRLGFAVANPLMLETGAREYPFAVLRPDGLGS